MKRLQAELCHVQTQVSTHAQQMEALQSKYEQQIKKLETDLELVRLNLFSFTRTHSICANLLLGKVFLLMVCFRVPNFRRSWNSNWTACCRTKRLKYDYSSRTQRSLAHYIVHFCHSLITFALIQAVQAKLKDSAALVARQADSLSRYTGDNNTLTTN